MIRHADARLIPLTGGVSSEIYRVEDGDEVFVVKRALRKLKVADEWYADTSRNHFEQAYMRYVAAHFPSGVPQLVYSNPQAGYFAMEYLDGFRNWKSDLMDGVFYRQLAEEAGRLLGHIHRKSWNDPDARAQFDALDNFDQLRIDPYLRTTAGKHPPLAAAILAEAERLYQSRQCLMHGDFSPKNMLHRDGRLVVLDCEVACYADAAFDLSFLLNHLLLKGLYHAPATTALPSLFAAVVKAYSETMGPLASQVLEPAAGLLPMLLLARVDGKSPVEYLTPKNKRMRANLP